ncbi:MAG: hypothetical protein AAFW73_18660 [Bacteroidota bacterium]
MNFSRLLLLLIPLLLILSTCQSPPGQSFITQDVTNFWRAYDQINTTSDTLLQAQYLQEHFLEPASPGLLALMEARRYTPAEYLDAIRRYPKFWNSLRANTEDIARHYPDIEQSIAQLRAHYPDLRPVPIYFLMGIFRTNGTILDQQILIGSEMALSSKAVDTQELPEHPRTFNDLHNPIEDLALLCTHEYVHTQQHDFVDHLLAYCVYEGIAEFVATLATGKASYLSAIAFGEAHYERVRDQFERDLYLTYRTYQWLWSTNTIFGERDLGYAVGYGMAQRYYEAAADKQAAIKTMIELDYADEAALLAFVDATGYLSRPIQELYDSYEAARPRVVRTEGVENGSRQVAPGTRDLTFFFSEPLNGYHTGVDYGEGGAATFPSLSPDRRWSEDGQSWTIRAELEPQRHYQILISNNFRLENGIQLQPFLLEFWTRD